MRPAGRRQRTSVRPWRQRAAATGGGGARERRGGVAREAARRGAAAAVAAPPPVPPPERREHPASSTSSDRISSRGSMSREAERSLSNPPQPRASASRASRAASASKVSPSSSSLLLLNLRWSLASRGGATLALQRPWSWEPAERDRERVGRVTLCFSVEFFLSFFEFRGSASEEARLDFPTLLLLLLVHLSLSLSLLSPHLFLPWTRHRGPHESAAGARKDVRGEGAGEHGGCRRWQIRRRHVTGSGSAGVDATALHRAFRASFANLLFTEAKSRATPLS